MDKKRRIVQWVTTLLYNLNIKGFITGRIYKGKLKGICVPGLNCYSCPGSLGSCPVGSLQASIGSVKRRVSGYVVGILVLFGSVFGRWICGWACPLGLLQDLLHKIPSPKIRRIPGPLKYIKYAVLATLVVGIPLFVGLKKGIGAPAFCKLICPQGTIAGLILTLRNADYRSMIGGSFIWKIAVLAVIIVLSVFIYRPFCRVLCPLGAIYGFFNSFALIHIEIDKSACTNCGACTKSCPMNVNVQLKCNSAECIRCGKCTGACPEGAVKMKMGYRRKNEEDTD